MENLLKKLGFKKVIQIKLKTTKDDFRKKLLENIDKKALGFFSGTFEAFSSSKNKFKGKVDFDGFELMKRRTFFNSWAAMAKAKGSFSEIDENIIIDIELNGFHPFFMVFLGFLLLFYSTFIFGFSFSSGADFVALPFIFIHGLFMIGIPLLIIKKSVTSLENDLEREFVYIINK